MNKVISITAIILSSILVLVSLPVVFFRIITPMPQQMRGKSVCFLAPELTWSSSMSDVTREFGTPVEKGEYCDITGTKSNTYETEYEGRKTTVYATRQTYPYKTDVFSYSFYVECADETDAQKVFTDFYNQIIEENKNDKYFSYKEWEPNNISFSINYGATGIHYDLEWEDNEVFLHADCMY